MPKYLVERSLKGVSMESLGEAQRAAISTAKDMRSQGSEISYIRSTFSPDDGRCLCLFEGSNAKDVRSLNETAGIPFESVVEVLDLHP